MAEVQDLLDFPPAPKLDVARQARPAEGDATPEMRGEELFFGKAQCATCHPAPYYTDNPMHDLKVERFFKPQTINGLMATATGRSRRSRCAASRTARRTSTTAGC